MSKNLRFAWEQMDSNHRSRKQQIYSLPHLATLEYSRTIIFIKLPVIKLSREPLVGFEPTTPRLQITCSGQLS